MAVPSQPSIGTRIQDWFQNLPLCTRIITALCVAIYVIQLLFGLLLEEHVCLSPRKIVEHFEVYRLLTAGFFHLGFLHLVMNMFAFQAIGPELERSVGSFTFTYLVLMFQLLSSLLNAFISFIPYKASFYPEPWFQCSIGFSSVLFSLLVVRCCSQQAHNMSIFGIVSVPAQWYPWVLLVLIQLLMPNSSFWGHITGILVAYLYVLRYLDRLIPSPATINNIESSPNLEWLVMKDGYITNTHFGSVNEDSLPTTTRQPESSGAGGFLGTWLSSSTSQADATSSSSSSTFVPFSGEGHSLKS